MGIHSQFKRLKIWNKMQEQIIENQTLQPALESDKVYSGKPRYLELELVAMPNVKTNFEKYDCTEISLVEPRFIHAITFDRLKAESQNPFYGRSTKSANDANVSITIKTSMPVAQLSNKSNLEHLGDRNSKYEN